MKPGAKIRLTTPGKKMKNRNSNGEMDHYVIGDTGKISHVTKADYYYVNFDVDGGGWTINRKYFTLVNDDKLPNTTLLEIIEEFKHAINTQNVAQVYCRDCSSEAGEDHEAGCDVEEEILIRRVELQELIRRITTSHDK